MNARTFIALAAVAAFGLSSAPARADHGWFSTHFTTAERRELPAGSIVNVRLVEDVDSRTAHVGQDVSAIVNRDVRADGVVVIPAGTPVVAVVTEVRPPKRYGGRALVTVEVRSLEVNGDRVLLDGEATAVGKRQVGKDAAIIAGSAVGGAILGDALGAKAAVGAVVGGGIGTAVAARRGPTAYLPAGTIVQARTTEHERMDPAGDV